MGVLVPNRLCSKPAALDFTVVSPLGSTLIAEVGTTARPSAEVRKHTPKMTMQECTELTLVNWYVTVSQWMRRTLECTTHLITFDYQTCSKVFSAQIITTLVVILHWLVIPHWWSYHTGGHTTLVVLPHWLVIPHWWSYHTGGITTLVVIPHWWSYHTGGHTTLVVIPHWWS